jgi:hypothetical protein
MGAIQAPPALKLTASFQTVANRARAQGLHDEYRARA